jgi:hypothetical protein
MEKGLVFHGNVTPGMRLYLVSDNICRIFLRIIILEFKNSDPRAQEITSRLPLNYEFFLL